MKRLLRFFSDEDGATMVEYALMVALIAVVCITTVSSVGKKVNNSYKTAGNALTS